MLDFLFAFFLAQNELALLVTVRIPIAFNVSSRSVVFQKN